MSKFSDNIVSELLKGHEPFLECDRYPSGDVYDHLTQAQFQYSHAYLQELRGREHGHFLTFLQINGIANGIRPDCSFACFQPVTGWPAKLGVGQTMYAN